MCVLKRCNFPQADPPLITASCRNVLTAYGYTTHIRTKQPPAPHISFDKTERKKKEQPNAAHK